MRRVATGVLSALAVLSVGVGAVSSAVGQGAGVPVMVGSGPDADACASVGAVTGLNPRGDNFLAVRAGPSSRHSKVDELYTGDTLFVCKARGRWLGVVYDPSGAAGGCGVASPMRRHAYAGPCRSGWVFERYVTIIAG